MPYTCGATGARPAIRPLSRVGDARRWFPRAAPPERVERAVGGFGSQIVNARILLPTRAGRKSLPRAAAGRSASLREPFADPRPARTLTIRFGLCASPDLYQTGPRLTTGKEVSHGVPV